MEELNKLYELRKKLEIKLDQISEELFDVYDVDDANEYYKILDMKDNIEKQIYEIDNAIILKSKPDASNEKIDLKKNIHQSSKFGEYYIFLHNTNTIVGVIDFQSEESIGGIIYEEYRGNHYLYEALNLLGEILYKNGIEYIYPIILKDNIASRKSVERYGGKLIKELENDLVQYECKTRLVSMKEENKSETANDNDTNIENLNLEELIELREKLLIKREKLSDKLHEIYEILREKENEFFHGEQTSEDKIKFKIEENKLYEEIDRIFKEIYKLRLGELDDIIYFKKPPVATNNVIDLRKSREYLLEDQNANSVIGGYEIYIHNTNICVGDIEYRGYHTNPYFADVGGSVIKEHRGNGYLFQALSLLKELLSRKGINDFWASANKDNIPSLKTIKKLGGILLDSGPNFEIYEVPTKKIELEEVTSKKM